MANDPTHVVKNIGNKIEEFGRNPEKYTQDLMK
jgi:hypothetical protein